MAAMMGEFVGVFVVMLKMTNVPILTPLSNDVPTNDVIKPRAVEFSFLF